MSTFEYVTGTAGNHVRAADGTIVCEIPDNSPAFRGDEWDAPALQALIAVLSSELSRVVLNTGAAEALEALGFHHYHTGGGCTAFRAAYTDNSECLITAQDDSHAPESMLEPVTVGLYALDDAGESLHDGMYFEFPSLAAAMPMLAARALADIKQEG